MIFESNGGKKDRVTRLAIGVEGKLIFSEIKPCLFSRDSTVVHMLEQVSAECSWANNISVFNQKKYLFYKHNITLFDQ